MMSVRMMSSLPLIFLLVIQVVYSDDDEDCKDGIKRDWSVTYSHSNICALKGSTVTMPCTYKYPCNPKITKNFWTKTLVLANVEPPNLFNDPEYSQRIQYLGDKQQICTIRLNDVTQKDSHKYYFRFITDKPDGRFIGTPGVTLDITDLHVESPESVTEGDTVSLTCKSTCNLSDRTTFIWWKNTQSLTERNNKLLLQSVRREDAGRYSCAVHGHNLTSPHVYLNVKYSPKNVSVSMSGSGEIVLGDSVNLTCRSDSNPPVLNYTWFKENESSSVGSGEIYSITSIRSDHSGEYKCKSRNEVGEKYSDTVTLNVMYSPRNVSVSMSGSGEIVLGDSVTLTCSSDSNPPANISWFKGTTYIVSGEIYRITSIRSDHSGEYKCKSRNEVGQKYSDTVTLNVMYSPRNVSVSMSGSGEIVLSDSVTLTCSSDSNPPVLNYTWFKENESSSVGSGQSYSALQSGFFYCVAQNQHGSQRSAAVQVTVKGHNTVLYAALAIVAGCALLIIAFTIFFMRKRKRDHGASDIRQKQVPPLSSDRISQDDHYENVTPKRGKDSAQIQYATVQHHRHKENGTHQPGAAMRSADHVMGDKSVIYSTIN